MANIYLPLFVSPPGAFGTVFHGLYQNDDVAVKIMNIPEKISPQEMKELKQSFKQEIAVWSKLRHPNVVQVEKKKEKIIMNLKRVWELEASREETYAHREISLWGWSWGSQIFPFFLHHSYDSFCPSSFSIPMIVIIFPVHS